MQGESLEVDRSSARVVEFRPGRQALVVDLGAGDQALHLVLLGSGRDFAYRRPADLPPQAEGDSWLQLDGRWLDVSEATAEIDPSEPRQLEVRVEGHALGDGRLVPLEGALTVWAPKMR